MLLILILPLHMVFRDTFLLNGKEEIREWMTNCLQINAWADKNEWKLIPFIVVIDEVIQQMQSRFSEQNVAFMKQMSFLTPVGLRSSDSSIDDILTICDQYGLNAGEVHKELLDFRSVYRVCGNDVDNGE